MPYRFKTHFTVRLQVEVVETLTGETVGVALRRSKKLWKPGPAHAYWFVPNASGEALGMFSSPATTNQKALLGWLNSATGA